MQGVLCNRGDVSLFRGATPIVCTTLSSDRVCDVEGRNFAS